MESHQLVEVGGDRENKWVLVWDDTTLTLDAPDGERVLELPLAELHRAFEQYELHVKGRLTLVARYGGVGFRKKSAVAAAVRRLAEASLAGDPAFCADLRRESLLAIPAGFTMSVVCGGLFGVYCWHADMLPDPPAGNWIWWVGPAISAVLFVLLSFAVAGPLLAYKGHRQWLSIRHVG